MGEEDSMSGENPDRTAAPLADPEETSKRLSRQSSIRVAANPSTGRDSLSVLKRDFEMPALGPVRVAMYYVPHRLILNARDFDAYLDTLAQVAVESTEQLAHVMLDDFNNELVPRWLQIRVRQGGAGGTGATHDVLVEDQQPKWNNPALLARIPPL